LGLLALHGHCVRQNRKPKQSGITQQVYEQAQVHIPEKQYAMLVAETPYRTSMQQNADAFKQQLPFYHIKPLYIGLCWLSYSVGFNLAFATVIPSLLAFFGIGLLLFFWLNKFVSEKQSILITCCILLTMPFTGIGRESSPDALSCFFIVLASYWFYIKKCWQWIAPALALAVLTRSFRHRVICEKILVYYLYPHSAWV
jgi:4-amino-4-deoxy-L-arabinose transferase-like glycosyltransferase